MWISPVRYSTGQQVDQLLTLCGELVTHAFPTFIKPEEPAIILPVLPKICEPWSLQAGANKLGTGWEQLVSSPVQAGVGFPVPR